MNFMVRPTIIDLNPVELKYYSFMISLNKFRGNWNVLSPKICVLKETKDIIIKAFNMLTRTIKLNNDKAYFGWL